MSNIIQPAKPNLLLWVDCEFTGLEVNKGHRIIEIAALVTTLSLEEVDSYSNFVNYEWGYTERLINSNPWWNGRFNDIARIRAGMESGRTPEEVDADLAAMVDAHFADTRPPLCGNSVHSDKKHIDIELPEFASRLHYRLIDISSLKILANLYRGIAYEGKELRHHALSDIRESVDELRFLLDKLGIISISELTE